MPQLIARNLIQLIGNTPLFEMQRYSSGTPGIVIAKIEAFNPGGSVKDRIALAMIEDAEKRGALKEGYTIIEPTSGNTGIGLAWVAMIKGYRIILTMPESMSVERRKLLQGLGAELVLTPAHEGIEGTVDQAQLLCEKIPDSFMPQQFKNPANPQAHYENTGPEIWQQTDGKVDVFVAGVGTGGTITGVGKYLKEKNPDCLIIAVEPAESAVISGKPKGPHMIQGIGAGFIPENLDLAVIDEVITISSQDAIVSAKEIMRTEGIFAGNSSGANALAAKRVALRDEFSEKQIVCVLCDTGERYLSTLLFHHD
mgnify:FL=1